MSALALQRAMRGRLVASPAVTGLVEAAKIVDQIGSPAAFPSIVLGEDQEVDAELTFERRHLRVYSTLHVWDRAASTVHAKTIVGAIRDALHGVDLLLGEGRLLDLKHSGTRYLRDPDGKTVHAIVTLEALIEEARP